MPLIYVFAASKTEARPALALAAPNRARGTIDQSENRCTVMITGMGRRNAAAKASAVLKMLSPHLEGHAPALQNPDAVLVIGVCGGLTEAVPRGRVVVYGECLSAGDQRPPLPCAPTVTKAILEALHQHGIACDQVTGITSARIVTTRQDRLSLAETGAAAVDMESYDILSVAASAGVPAAVLRVASDSVDTTMPDFNRALSVKGEIRNLKALAIALRSPLRTLRLVAASRHAMEQLGPAVKLILQSRCFSNIET